jgi:hypothetical protein
MGIKDSGFVWPCTFLSGLKIEDRARLAASYVQCRDWQHDNMDAHTKSLAAVFRGFPELDGIRMLTVDPVLHLGVWLQPSDGDLLSRDHTLFQDRSSQALIQDYSRNTHPRMYTNEPVVIKDCVIDASCLARSFAPSSHSEASGLRPRLIPYHHTSASDAAYGPHRS